MKFDKFAQNLDAVAGFLSHIGCPEEVEQLRSLRSILAGQEKKTVASIVNHILKQWAFEKRKPSHPQLLKSTIKYIAGFYSETGPTATANDYSKLLELFTGDETQSMPSFSADIMSALQSKTIKNHPKKKTQTNQNRVTEFTSLLKQEMQNDDHFNKLLDELKVARKVTKIELEQIAEDLMGYKEKYQKKGDIVEAIKVWRLNNALLRAQEQSDVPV